MSDVPRTFDQPGVANADDGTDIGAVELGDITGPNVVFDSTPPATTSDNTATVVFSSPDGDLDYFECSIDGAAFSTCASPFTTPPLSEGAHSFEVRPVDTSGNSGPTQSVDFTVDTRVTGPDVTIPKKLTVKGRELKAKISAGAQEDVSALATGTLIFKPKGKGKTRKTRLGDVSKQIDGGGRKILRVKFEGGKNKRQKLTRKLKRTLKGGKTQVRLRAKVKFTDDGGNNAAEKRVSRLKLKR